MIDNRRRGMVNEAIKKLVKYGLDTGLIQEEDRIYATNQILDVLKLDEYGEPETEIGEVSLEETLKELLDYAHESGVLPEDSVVFRDLFDTRLMNCLCRDRPRWFGRSGSFITDSHHRRLRIITIN